MKKVVVMFVSAAALATVGMAAASNSMAASNNQSNNAAGIFISGNLGYGTTGYKKTDFNSTPSKLNTSGFAWNAGAGYQFNQYVAVEGDYTRFADTKATFSTLNATNTIKLDGLGLDVKGILPVTSQFDLFGKLGAMRMNESQTVVGGSAPAKLTGHAWTPELGVGTAFNVNQNVALTLQDVYTFKTNFKKPGLKVNIPYTNSILAGVSYKFNV